MLFVSRFRQKPPLLLPLRQAYRSYMDVRTRPSHSQMFDRNGRVEAIKVPPTEEKAQKPWIRYVAGFTLIFTMAYAFSRPSLKVMDSSSKSEKVD